MSPKVYYTTYADGVLGGAEVAYTRREGRASHDARKYEVREERRPTSYFPGDLPTPPRRSNSPSPIHRRDSTYVHSSGVTDPPSPRRHHSHRDRHERHEPLRRSSRHVEADREVPPAPKLKRSSTLPTHYVVIDQDQSRFASGDIPLGPVHIAPEHRHSSRDHDREHLHRRNSARPDGYVVINDERERRRHGRERKRRLSTSETAPPPPPPAVPEPELPPRRFSLRRAATVNDGPNPASGSSPSPRHIRWEDRVRMERDRQNAEIEKRRRAAAAAPEVHQESRLKSILKRATGMHNLRRGVERMDLHESPEAPTGAELNLYDRDRLKARFGSDEGGDRERRRRSKVWVDDDRYQYHH